MKRSKHSLSGTNLLSCNMGELVPIGIREVLPGDTFQHSTSLLLRTAPLLAPVMHPVDVKVHHFFVPFRLIWEDWEKFITGGPDGMDASVFPTITGLVADFGEGSLADYLGVPPPPGASVTVSALPFRAYKKIFNEYYRDQDLTAAEDISIASGPDSTTSTVINKVAWQKDYFTTARPWTQKGPDIHIPLGDTAPVYGEDGTGMRLRGATSGVQNNMSWSSSNGLNASGSVMTNGELVNIVSEGSGTTNVYADTSELGGTLQELRLASALLRYEEARARYGSRYTEYLAYLGVKSSDSRLQRPEYLGGGKQTIQFSEVLQSAPDTDAGTSDPQGVGELKGHGIASLRSNRYRRFFEEHGYVISLMSVKPRTIYMNGLERHWNRRTKEDFFQKELQFIGQQAIECREVVSQGSEDPTKDLEAFGWQDRYDEYRQAMSRVSGEFRSSLNYWHMARILTGDPVLNNSFIECNPTDRIFPVEYTQNIWVMAHHSIQARRIVAKNGGNSVLI